MKKKVHVLLVLAIILLLTAALACCGGDNTDTDGGDTNPYDTNIDAGTLAEYLSENITFADELTKVDNDIAYEIYGIEEGAVKDIAVYMSSGATAEEIAVLTVESDDSALLASAAYSSRIEQQKTGFENYVPEELPKLENAVIMQIDDAVIMIVCNDAEEAGTAINSYIETYIE